MYPNVHEHTRDEVKSDKESCQSYKQCMEVHPEYSKNYEARPRKIHDVDKLLVYPFEKHREIVSMMIGHIII